MMGYGPEDKNVVLELTYNYGVTEYDKGNAYAQVETIHPPPPPPLKKRGFFFPSNLSLRFLCWTHGIEYCFACYCQCYKAWYHI